MWHLDKKQTKILRATGRFSLYHDLIAKVWAGEPGELVSAPFNRLCTLARKMGVRYVVVEDASSRQEVAQEMRDLHTAVGGEGAASAVSVSFLYRNPLSPAREDDAHSLIGQCVVVTYPHPSGNRSYVFEAIFRRPQSPSRSGLPLLNNYLPFAQNFTLRALEREYTVEAMYFCQGNGWTTTPAHAAMRATADWLTGSSRLPTGPIDLTPIRSTAEPLEIVEMTLRSAKTNIVVYRLGDARSQALRQDAWSSAAALVESGWPVLLIAEAQDGRDVLLPVFGYTLNTDEWHPAAIAHYDGGEKMASSSLWVDHLVVHDPNIGPYLCLSRAWFDGVASKGGFRPRLIIAQMAEGTRLSAAVAERIAGVAANDWTEVIAKAKLGRGRWWRRLVEGRSMAVLRTTRVNRDDYATHLHEQFRKASKGRDEEALNQYLSALPQEFWLTEVTLPQLFLGNRKKLGEVVVRSDAKPETASVDAVVAARFPSLLVWRHADALLVQPVHVAVPGPLLQSTLTRHDW